MLPKFDSPEILFAITATRQASFLAKQVQDELIPEAIAKPDLSPVTVADYGVQALVGRLLQMDFPRDRLVAEENAATLRLAESAETLAEVTHFVQGFLPDSVPEAVCDWIDRGGNQGGDRYWVLDPIDGTKGYLRGEQYAIALALIEGGQVQLGVLGCPNLVDAYRPDSDGPGSLVIAVRGGGTWTTSIATPGEYSALHVSERRDPALARMLRSYEAGHTNTGQIDEVVRLLGAEAEPVLMDSQAKYAILAAGKGDVLLRLLSPQKPDYRENIWDQAAGSIIVEEAGGRVTDLAGHPLDFNCCPRLTNNRGVAASNGYLHPALLEALKTAGA